jgi:hypothetical protein
MYGFNATLNRLVYCLILNRTAKINLLYIWIPERERETLACALRSRPAGSEPLSAVDYLYLSVAAPSLDGKHRAIPRAE